MTKEEMIKSVAFSADLVNQLNTVASSLDSRLFMFAYYEPKTMPNNESFQLYFYIALTNLYGLFWDCGSFVRTRLMTYSFKNSNQGILPRVDNPIIQRNKLQPYGMDIKTRFNTLLDDISSARSVFCHNNSSMLCLNSKDLDNQNKWFESVLQMSVDNTSLGQLEWEQLFVSLVDRANHVIKDLFFCLDWVSKIKISNATFFELIIDDWLENGIGRWYNDKKDLTINILSDFYDYYLGGDIYYAIRIREYNRYLNFRNNLQKWLTDNFGEEARNGEKWLNPTNIRKILKDNSTCPCPALPIEFLSLLTNEVKTHVQNNRIK